MGRNGLNTRFLWIWYFLCWWNYVGLKWNKCMGVVGMVGGFRVWNFGLWLVNRDMGGISGDLWGMWDWNCVVGIGSATRHFWKSCNPYFLTIYPHLIKLSDNSPVFSILLKFKQSQKRLDNIVLSSFFIFLFFCFVMLSILSYSVDKWITLWITCG